MSTRTILVAASVLIGTGSLGCTVKQQEAPPLTGPSALATSVTVTARPDLLTQDGVSQSAIQVLATGPDGQGLSGLGLRISTMVGGVVQDFGTLQSRQIVTDRNGRASTVYTAPPAAPPLLGGNGTTVSILANVIGNDAVASQAHTPLVDIRLVPPGVILPPADTPTALFTFGPASPTANSPVAFDGASSCPGSAATGGGCAISTSKLTTWAWTFGDGGTGSGAVLTHAFNKPGTFNVTLTVTNDRELSASTTKQITVAAGTPPTALFAFSPAKPEPNQQVSFNASLSTAAPGHSIVSYNWDFGDGVATGRNATHTWTKPNTYNVVLVVTDDNGLTGAASQTVIVAVPSTTTSKK
jgi:PKD repeat protein